MSQSITYRYHRPGKGTFEYHERLVADEPDVKVLLLEEDHGALLQVEGERILEPDAPIVWFIFPETWYEIGRFHLADGTFTGWYTNLCTPIEMGDDAWSCTDLFLDHWLSPSGQSKWLDEDEFTQAVGAGLVDDEQVKRVSQQRAHIDSRVAAGAWPPTIALEFDLERARKAR